jgi:hypothetical protein
VRRIQLENDWTLTVPNEYPAPVRYAPRNVHDAYPFYLELKAEDDEISMAHGYHFSAKQIAVTPPADRPVNLAVTMWRHELMFHVMVSDAVAACGRDELEPGRYELGNAPTYLKDGRYEFGNVPSHLICPICRPYTGVPRPPRPERQWIHDHGSVLMHIALSERGTACALYCTPEDYERLGPFARTADPDLADDAQRCEVCVKNQDYVDHLERWRYL